jgi:hypothetical protein
MVSHGGHSEHGEKRELVLTRSITPWVITRKVQEVRLLAVPAVFAVVNRGFQVHMTSI